MNPGISILADSMRFAGRRLAQLSSDRITLHIGEGQVVALADVETHLGGGERAVCAAIVGIRIGADLRHPQMRFVIAVSPQTRRALTTILAGERYAEDPAMSASVIQEIGNIAASAIANHIAEKVALPVHATPPDVVEDLWSPLVMGIIGSFENPHDDLALVTTELRADQQVCDCTACLIVDDGSAITRFGDAPAVQGGGR